MSTKEPQSSSNGQLLTNANGDESNSEIHMEEDQPQNESDIDIEEDDEENEATEDGIQGAEDRIIKLYYIDNERLGGMRSGLNLKFVSNPINFNALWICC